MEPHVEDGIRYFMDGNMVCAVHDRTFEDVQVSPAGYGVTKRAALVALVEDAIKFVVVENGVVKRAEDS